MGRLQDKVAIITGAGSGQGKAAAQIFAKEGAKVVIAEWNEEAGKAVEKELLDAGYDVLFVKTDISSEENVKAMVDATMAKYGKIDVLFNNGGIGFSARAKYCMADVIDTPLADWNAIIQINLNGVYLCCKYVLPIMREQGFGSIVNNSSLNALIGESGADAYTASKGGICALTRVMAKDNGPFHIRVNCICPGAVNTPMIADALELFEGYREQLEAKTPLGKFAEPEDIAYAALFLASDEAGQITGVTLPVDGGWFAV